MNIDWRKYLAQMAFVLALLGAAFVAMSVAGCSSTGRSGTDARTDTRTREVTVTHGQIPVTAADGAVSLVTVTNTTDRTLTQEQVSRIDTQDERHSAPDVAAIAAVAQPIIAAATGLSLGQGAGALATLALTTAAGWMSRRGEVKDKDQRLERLRIDRDETRTRVEQLARQLPPDAGDDRS